MALVSESPARPVVARARFRFGKQHLRAAVAAARAAHDAPARIVRPPGILCSARCRA
jgi:hypothetical protein